MPRVQQHVYEYAAVEMMKEIECALVVSFSGQTVFFVPKQAHRTSFFGSGRVKRLQAS